MIGLGLAAFAQGLTGWRGYVAAGLVGGAVVSGVLLPVVRWYYGAQIAGLQRDQAQQLADATQLARQKEQARWADREVVIDDAKKQTAAALADADLRRAESERLRQQLAILQRRARDSALAGPGQGQSGADTLDLLVGLLTRMDESGGAVSQYADQLRIAGLACEAAHDTLRENP